MTYNTHFGPDPALLTVLDVIESIDVLALQEQSTTGSTTSAILDWFDTAYGPGVYDMAEVEGESEGGGIRALIYNVTTVELIDQETIGITGESHQPRQSKRPTEPSDARVGRAMN